MKTLDLNPIPSRTAPLRLEVVEAGSEIAADALAVPVLADQATERPSNGWRPVAAGLRTGYEIGHTLVTQTRYC